MDTVKLGKTGIVVNKNGFGALPIQRISDDEAVRLLRKAYDNGINFYDTARFYTDSEAKIGLALSDVRDRIFIASKTGALTAEGFWKDLHTTLANLKTDYLDIYQFHNPPFCPEPGSTDGLYEAMLEAVRQGKVRHIGISNHRQLVAKQAIESGLYETLQYPFSYISAPADLDIVNSCLSHDVGFICMKALAGGLVTNSALAYAFLNQYEVLPIWGMQRVSELDEFLSYQKEAPVLTDEFRRQMAVDKMTFAEDFCRGCGYCMPCPVGIKINDCARMTLFLQRAPLSVYLTEEWKKEMDKIDDCLHCNTCHSRCPYGLNTPLLLKKNHEDFKRAWSGKMASEK